VNTELIRQILAEQPLIKYGRTIIFLLVVIIALLIIAGLA
jgi:hypothetical protein